MDIASQAMKKLKTEADDDSIQTAVHMAVAHVFRTPAERPNLSASSLIWTASSRVGASTSMLGPLRGSGRLLWIIIKPGNRNPQVLPLPVFAMATRSLPCKATGHACAWMGVGAL